MMMKDIPVVSAFRMIFKGSHWAYLTYWLSLFPAVHFLQI